MKKFLIVEGLPGIYVPKPGRRRTYVGHKRVGEMPEDPKEWRAAFASRVEAIEYDPAWVKAARKGELKLHGVVKAKTHTEALAATPVPMKLRPYTRRPMPPVVEERSIMPSYEEVE